MHWQQKQVKYADEYASVYDNRVLVLEGIEKEASSSAESMAWQGPATDNYPSAPSEIRIAEFLPLVNSEYQRYLPQKVKSSERTEVEKRFIDRGQSGEAQGNDSRAKKKHPPGC